MLKSGAAVATTAKSKVDAGVATGKNQLEKGKNVIAPHVETAKATIGKASHSTHSISIAKVSFSICVISRYTQIAFVSW